MFTKSSCNEEAYVALVLVLAVAIVARVANGPGPLSLGRIVRGGLSNPVPWRKPETTQKVIPALTHDEEPA